MCQLLFLLHRITYVCLSSFRCWASQTPKVTYQPSTDTFHLTTSSLDPHNTKTGPSHRKQENLAPCTSHLKPLKSQSQDGALTTSSPGSHNLNSRPSTLTTTIVDPHNGNSSLAQTSQPKPFNLTHEILRHHDRNPSPHHQSADLRTSHHPAPYSQAFSAVQVYIAHPATPPHHHKFLCESASVLIVFNSDGCVSCSASFVVFASCCHMPTVLHWCTSTPAQPCHGC